MTLALKQGHFPLISVVMLASAALSGCVQMEDIGPLPESWRRPTALDFGLYVTPEPHNNPIDPPERFTGFHAGLDYEVFPEELQREVPVHAVCGGTVLYSGFVDGYGGALVQRCSLYDSEVTVLYGHLDPEGLLAEGLTVRTGDTIGKLAQHRSFWSGWNRKHLHLGIHRGDEVDFRGYVDFSEELDDFVDPRHVLPRTAAGRSVPEHRVPDVSREQ